MADPDWRRETIEWTGYADIPMPYSNAFEELTKLQARETFEYLMAMRDARRLQLTLLLERNGHAAKTLVELLVGAELLIRDHVTINPDDPERLDSEWYPVILDTALVLGDEYIRRYPSLSWKLGSMGGKRSLSFQQPVVSGFTNFGVLKNKDREVALIAIVNSQAWSYAQGEPDEPNQFLRAVEHAAQHI